MILGDQLPPNAAKPGCYLCNTELNVHGVKMFDTLIDIDFEGRLGICNLCVGSAAEQLGHLSPEKADRLRTKNKKLQEENDRLTRQLLAAEAVSAAIEAFVSIPGR